MSYRAQLIHSQPTNSLLPQILTQGVISALLDMPPGRTRSVASSHRKYEGDVKSSDDLYEADSPIEERPQTHANRAMKHELGDDWATSHHALCYVDLRRPRRCVLLPLLRCQPITLCRSLCHLRRRLSRLCQLLPRTTQS